MKRFFSSKPLLFIATSIFIMLLIFLNRGGLLEVPRGLFFRIVIPSQKLVIKVTRPIFNFSDTIISIRDLQRQNRELQQKLNRCLTESTQFKEIKLENEKLRQALDIRLKRDWRLLPANISGFDPENLGAFIMIDKGKKDGLNKGDPVIVADGITVGRITETSHCCSKVLLTTNSTSSINALIQSSRASGIVKGEHGLGLVMEMILQGKEIKVGDIVITSGLGGVFPKGLVIGQVEKVRSSTNEIFQTAILKLLLNIKDLEMVFVITDY